MHFADAYMLTCHPKVDYTCHAFTCHLRVGYKCHPRIDTRHFSHAILG